MPESALEIFRDACGLRAPLALECQDAGRAMGGAVTYQLECPFALIGRDPQFDLVFHNAEVSRRHAFLHVIDGRVFCIDLDSRTRLRWDGIPEPRMNGWLDPGGTLRIGPYAIRRVGADVPENPVRVSPDPLNCDDNDLANASSLPRAGLELPVRVGNRDELWRIDGRLALIGRFESCQLILRDSSVSRFHAALVRTPKGVWITDLQSRDGVYVNGVKVRWAWVEDGDTVRIGQFTSILRYETVPEGISRRDVPLEAGSNAHDSQPSGLSGPVGTSLAVRSTSPPAIPARIAKKTAALTPDLLPLEKPQEWERGGLPASQIAMWQQQMQMMESFHKDMILMVQMFMAMHREHRVAIRDELDRVEKLTRKLNVLQQRLLQAEGQDGRSPGIDPSMRKGDKSRSSKRNGATQAGTVNKTNDAPPRESSPAQPLDKSASSRADSQKTTSNDPTRKAAKSDLPGLSPAELHSQLTQRISELQRERQNYWQRILSAINK